MDPRTPVTLVTGFLGSGKTTLVNRLVRQDPERFFVLVNEYGEVPLDHLLVEGRAEALAEGCACCGPAEELVEALAALHRLGGSATSFWRPRAWPTPAPSSRSSSPPGCGRPTAWRGW